MSEPIQPTVDLKGDAVFQRHRIHISQLVSGVYVVSIVHFGAQDSGVENLRGEYRTREEAMAAAKQHIEEEGNHQTEPKT